MSSYSKISSRFWTGETGRALRGDLAAQLVAAYLLTNSHANMIGFYYLPVAYIANDTGIPIEEASKALQRVCDEGFCRYDSPSEVVWVVGMARNQVGERLEPLDKRVKGVEKEYRSIPNNPFLKDFFDEYGVSFHLKQARAFQGPSKPVAVAVAVAVAASAAVAATATENRPGRASPVPAPKREGPTTATWTAYVDAYKARYGVDPTRNATVNSQIAAFVKRVPVEEAPEIAAFYVRHNKSFYVGKKHSAGLMLADAEGLRTEWLSGKTVTDTEARQADRTQANANAFAPLIAEAEERERLAGAGK